MREVVTNLLKLFFVQNVRFFGVGSPATTSDPSIFALSSPTDSFRGLYLPESGIALGY